MGEEKFDSRTVILMNKIYSLRKVSMPCFAVLMSVYLSYLSGDLCTKIQVQFRFFLHRKA